MLYAPVKPFIAMLGGVLALTRGAPALASNIEAVSHIDSALVYPDAAAVTRTADVELPEGATTLIFRGLPMGLDPASLRVSAQASGRVSIASIETRVTPEGPPESVYDGKLKALRSDRENWQTTLEALEAKKAMMIRFSQSGPEKLSPDSRPLDISQWQSAWDTVGAGLAKTGDDLNAAKAKIREIDAQIAALEQIRQKPPSQVRATREASVAVDAESNTRASLRLTYRIAGAGWQPAYDARLETNAGGKAALELVRRATIAQRTGEDWTDVALSVSTTRAQRNAEAPEVYTQRISFYEPPVAAALAGGVGARARQAALPQAAPPQMDRPALDAMLQEKAVAGKSVDAVEQQSTIDAAAYQASFQIPGRVTIASDGASKGFRILTANFSPDLLLRASPAIDPTAYLQARIVNGEDAPLLPGAVNVTRDGEFVGVSRIGLVAPGDSTDLGFGADDRVKIARAPVKRKENEPQWFGSTKTETREFKTTIKNLHPFPLKMNIVDQIPISENTAITIDQLPATTPPTEKNINDRRSVMGWTFDLAPGDTKNITLAYRMKWPADRDVMFETLPDGRTFTR